ncbi:DUF4440 domain-containing protein [Horticoccus sp. 23ND18S-11]|uniref:DUF4440 domain-containing protein n=1 Tax=Horticoccus sp. 23ND18S-11 TaxID=3391832 RepID=UPI0039C9C8EB
MSPRVFPGLQVPCRFAVLSLLAALAVVAARGADAAEPEIRAAIAGIRTAILERSAAGIVKDSTPDWTFTGPDGVSFDRAGFIARTEALFARVVAIESLDTTVDRIAFTDSATADVTITQTMVRAERSADTAVVTRLRLRYREQHAWVRTEQGWRVRQVRFIGTPERTVLAAEPPLPAAERDAMLAAYRTELAALETAAARSPRDVAVYSRRGDRQLFLGNAAAAVTDFERMIALDPTQEAPHWRLGIAYYFSGKFAAASKQFEKYHAYDGGDRENGLWKFFCDVEVAGADRARAAMLRYTRFDREPFPGLYALAAGSTTTAEFFADLKARELLTNPQVMFFAHYYAGLHEARLGHSDLALALLREAVANRWARSAENGPTYMWQVARLHFEARARRQPPERRD